MRGHKIDPGVSREIIYKDNIVTMTALRGKRSRTLDIRVNKVERTLRHGLAMRIRQLDLFAKSTTQTV